MTFNNLTSKEESEISRIRLKGGSLSGTYLIDDGNKKKVRKEISFEADREYGFVRWHSQLKKIQRLESIFPNLFPKVINFGLKPNCAYFDLEFIEDSVSGFEFLANNPERYEIDNFFNQLIIGMNRLHSVKRSSSTDALNLYIYEEIERPLQFCSQDPEFKEFLKHKEIIFNGKTIPSLFHKLEEVYKIGQKYHTSAWECYTHGNITLENLLWVPKNNKIWFIDLYEENIADNIYNEYSQILQSSNSYYEIFNSLNAKIEGNTVTLNVGKYPGLDYFNEKFLNFMKEKLTNEERKIVKLYEVSQFTRMLPFKLNVAKDKMIFFYSLASSLFNEIMEEE